MTPLLMKYDPVTGDEKPYPSEAKQYRKYHGNAAWLINPYSGNLRHALDIGSDVLGLLLVKNERLEALANGKET